MNPSDLKRFFSKVSFSEEGCWNWMASTNRENGYGKFSAQVSNAKKWFSAHRISFELFVGAIPSHLVIDHLCLNKRCVCPSHMQLVTQRQNALLGTGTSAKNYRKLECVNGHTFNLLNTYRLHGRRYCRDCHKAAKVRYRLKLKSSL